MQLAKETNCHSVQTQAYHSVMTPDKHAADTAVALQVFILLAQSC